jgi:hypothetical protein
VTETARENEKERERRTRQEDLNESAETDNHGETRKERIQAFHPSDLVIRTFLMEPKEDGSRSKMTTSPRMFYVS